MVSINDAGHPSTYLSNPFGSDVYIDIPMVPLIEDLWDHNIETSSCCQGRTDCSDGLAHVILVKQTDSYSAKTIISSYGPIVEEYLEYGEVIIRFYLK
jgi:hypothetical protein